MELWTYREEVGFGPTTTVTGFSVEAVDGSIGKIDDASNDVSSSYVVVDTGWWIFGEKRLIPAGMIDKVDLDNETVHVSLTKDQVKSAPKYDPDRWTSSDDAYRSELGDYYARY